MKTSKNVSVMVRASLLCVGCDIPAACGFLGHRATTGCSNAYFHSQLIDLVKNLTIQISNAWSGHNKQMNIIVVKH